MSVVCPAPPVSGLPECQFHTSAPMPSPAALYAHEGIALSDEQEQARTALARRYQLQQMAANILPHKRALQGCQRWVAYNKEAVQLLSYPALKKGKIEGLQSCASPWDCPVCSSKIATRRVEKQLKPALAEAKRRGYHVVMVTWTIQHNRHDELLLLMSALKESRKQLRCSRPWTRLKNNFGLVGSIRALEVTHGVNGWHPHFHELLFFKCKADLMLLLAELRHQWSAAIEKAGLREVNDHGVKVSDTYKDVEEYIAKFGKDPKWGVAEEMGRQQTKRARAKKGLAPFQLLGVACDNEGYEGYSPRRAGELFREYSAAMAGFAQLYGGKLWQLLELPELTDAEIEAMEEERQHREVFAELDVPAWNMLRADGLHVPLHSLLAEGDRDGVDALIAPYLRPEPTDKLLIAYSIDKHEGFTVPHKKGTLTTAPLVRGGATLHFEMIHPFDPEDPFSDPRDEEKRSLMDISGGRYQHPLLNSPDVRDFLGRWPTEEELERLQLEDQVETDWGGRGHPLFVHLRALDRVKAFEFSDMVKLPAWLHRAYSDLCTRPAGPNRELMTCVFHTALTDKEYFLLCDWKAQQVQPLRLYAAPEFRCVLENRFATLRNETPEPSGPRVHEVVSRKGRRLLHRKHTV